PNTKRWLLGKFATRASSQREKSYHFTSRIGGSPRVALPPRRGPRGPRQGPKGQRSEGYHDFFRFKPSPASPVITSTIVPGSGTRLATRKPTQLSSKPGPATPQTDAAR